jgi:hypothetical protein
MAGKLKRGVELTWLMDTEIRRLQIHRAIKWAGVLDACDLRYPIETTRALIGEWERIDEQIKVLQDFAGHARAMLSVIVLQYIVFQQEAQTKGYAYAEMEAVA